LLIYIKLDLTYTFATAVVSGSNFNSWLVTRADTTATNPYRWVIAAPASSLTSTDTIATGDWADAVLDAAEGFQAATIYLYQRTSSASSPAVINNDTTYTFSTKALGGSLDSWSQTIPTSGGDYIHVTTAVALAINSATTDTIVTGDWSTPTTLAQKGEDGDAGLNQATVTIYQLNNDSSSAPTLINDDSIYTFSNKTLTNTNGLDGWSQTFPATTSSNGIRWVTKAIASANSSTDTISTGDWSAAVVIGDDKNIRNAQVDLYQRSSTTSAPADPNGNLTYTFATGVLSGSNFNSWTVEIPATGNEYVFKISAVALGNANATTDTIATGDWSDASLITVPGDDGQGVKYASLYKLNDSGITTNNFGTFADPTSGAESGWTIAVPDIGTTDGNKIYVTTRTFTSDGESPQTSTWTAPVIHSQYTKGATGRKVAELIIFYPFNFNDSTTAAPSTPSTGVYNFSNSTVASLPSGWTQTKPPVTVGYINFKSEALATESSGGTTSDAISWSSVSIDGYPFGDVEFIFKRATATETPSVTNYGASLPSGWYDDIANVPSGSNSIWTSKGIVAYALSSGTYSYKWTWGASSQIEGSDGAAGAAGLKNAQGILYATAHSYSTTPSMTVYTFSSKVFTGGNASSWTLTPPALTGANVNTWYQVNYAVTETTAAGGVGVPSFGTPAVRVSGFGGIITLDEDEVSINNILDPSNVRTYAGYAGTGFDSSGRVKVGIISGGVAVTVAEMKEAKLRTYSGLNTSGELTGALNSTAFPMRAMVTGANAAAVKSTISLNNVANETRATILAGELTGSLNATSFPMKAMVTGANAAAVKSTISLNNVANENRATILGGNLTGTIDSTAVATVKGGAVKANLGLSATGDVNRAVPQGVGGTGLTSNSTILNTNTTKANVGLGNVDNTSDATTLGGELTGSLNATAFPMKAMVTGANAAAVKTTIALNNVDNSSASTIQAGTTKANVGLGSVDNTSDNTIRAGNITGTVNSIAVATVTSGAASGATANQDSTGTILGGELTGSLNATAFPMKAMVTGANAAAVKTTIALNNVDNSSASTIQAGTTKANVGLGSVDNQSASTIQSGTTAANVGLGSVTNESKSTMFAAPTFTGTVAGVSKTHVGLSAVDNTSDNTIRAGNITGTVNSVAVADISGGAGKANAGLAANGDVNRSVPQGQGGTGLTSAGTAIQNTSVVLSSAGVLTGAGSSSQVNIGSVAGSNFDTSGDFDSACGLNSTLTIGTSSGNKIVCGFVTIDGQNGRILIVDA